MTKVEFDNATIEDFKSIYGYSPNSNIFGWVAKVNDVIIGIAGVYLKTYQDTLFLNITENNLDCFVKFKIAKQIKTMLKLLVSETDLKLCLIRDINEMGSDIFLKKIGFYFSYIDKDGNEVWAYGY